ncbi:retrovirus-related Pol polyprotein from transposon TNT 1-94 [Trichonephila clavipes]|nr:retrovirus-related Pol polyprotein from transposon TNT 1-94 [Trichonephila clavipes]
MEWLSKNSDAIAYIKLSLADEQALQFAAEDNAKVMWDKIRATFISQGEDRKIDAGNELKLIRMKNGETVADYIARARGILTKCHSLGLDVSPKELVYHTVRGLNGKFSKVRDILQTQRGKTKYENLTDKRIKNIRTDNGLEFVKEQLDTYLANSEIFHEKKFPYNSGSNGKAERANRLLLERARSLLYESKLPLKFWAEAINCSTQVSNVTPRKGKEKIPLEIWAGNKPKLNHLKKFGYVAYFHVPKVLRSKFEVPGRHEIMLAYARERRGYQIYDIKNQKVIEERSVKFNESLKDSNYLGEIENETWDIDSFFEVSPERNEINQNTENGVLSNFDINNGPVAIENDNSIPLQTTSSPQTGRIQLLVLELNDVQNQIPVRRSEGLKSKQMSVHLVNNVPNSYFEAKNSTDWQNWK